jgi:FkbM family methyltransferase
VTTLDRSLFRRGWRAIRSRSPGDRPSAAESTGCATSIVPPGPPPQWRTVENGPLTGVELFLPGAGCGWADAIVRQNAYESAFLPTFVQLARRGGVLYDVGAHIGFFSCAWIAGGGNAVEVFEPVPRNQSVLRETFRRNGWTAKARLHCLALADSNRTAALHVNEGDLGDTSLAYVDGVGGIDWRLRAQAYPPGNTLDVEVRRLDDLVEEMALPTPAVVKIDVEGGEAHVIEGASRILSEWRPTILAEVHNVYAGMQMAERLESLGYSLRLLGKNHWLPACLWVSSQRIDGACALDPTGMRTPDSQLGDDKPGTRETYT